MIEREYNIEESSNPIYKYVVYRYNSINNGCCYRGIFHSNNKEECEKFIDKQIKNDLHDKRSLVERIKDISERNKASRRKYIHEEKYKNRMKYVKSYRNESDSYYDYY